MDLVGIVDQSMLRGSAASAEVARLDTRQIVTVRLIMLSIAALPPVSCGVLQARASTGARIRKHRDLEHFPEKWTPVFRKEMRPSIESRARSCHRPHRILVSLFGTRSSAARSPVVFLLRNLPDRT